MILSKPAKDVADMALVKLANDSGHPSISQVKELISLLGLAFQLSDMDVAAAVAYVESRHILSMPAGVIVAEPTFEKWLAQRKSEIDPFFWNRFRRYLLRDQGWGPAVVNKLDETVDDLLEYAGDPLKPAPWERRGLVMGDVQSGKTATYTALCNKAADAGYRLIILLAGTLNSLRFQTQERLDEGFVGRDSSQLVVAGALHGREVGVGLFDNRLPVLAFTTKLSDFNASLTGIGTPLDGLKAPALMVIKKNKTILQNVYNWLRTLNSQGAEKIQVPLLLIDDEADAASVNTGPESEPRAINKGIRQLLELFSRSSYVGFTATPFANVFIAPDSTAEMLGNDLFPRDYIYSLEPPSNYVGPVKVFEDESDRFLRFFDDAEAVFPSRHKTDLHVTQLPASLIDALRTFLLSNSIRDLRNEGQTHRSMLVNVSWANSVQHQVGSLLKGELARIVSEIQAFGQLDARVAEVQSVEIGELRRVWQAEYATIEFTWSSVLRALFEASKSITVRTVNMTAPSSRLNYEEHKSTGLRVVAVGGNALSRGLTLAGLCVSYIFRNSQAYDTLLQMGRWFGYRPDYEDLCRIWMTRGSANYYSYITLATQELRAELRRMRDVGATPRQFGLKVRDHPDALTVTARAKMKTAEAVLVGSVSLSQQRLEATQLTSSIASLAGNDLATKAFIDTIGDGGMVARSLNAREAYRWSDVPRQLISQFLRSYEVHPSATRFQPKNVANFLDDGAVAELSLWDVAFVSGDRAGKVPLFYHGLEVFTSKRLVDLSEDVPDLFEIRKRRLGAERDDAIGMDITDRELANADSERDKEQTGHSNSAFNYRSRRKRPLLLIYLVNGESDLLRGEQFVPPVNPFVAISLTFPRYADDTPERQVVYQANQVLQEMYKQMALALRSESEQDGGEDGQLEY
jgi:hypothetical protein